MKTLVLNPKHETLHFEDRDTIRILSAATSVLEQCIEDDLEGSKELEYYRISVSYFQEGLSADYPYRDIVLVNRLRNTFHRFCLSYPSSKQVDLFHRSDLQDQIDSLLDRMKLDDEDRRR